MKCPRCTTSLETVDLGESGGEFAAVVIDRCPNCSGVWYDEGELDARDESVWTNVEELEYEARLSGGKRALCPRCEVRLDPVSPKGVRKTVMIGVPNAQGFGWMLGSWRRSRNLPPTSIPKPSSG